MDLKASMYTVDDVTYISVPTATGWIVCASRNMVITRPFKKRATSLRHAKQMAAQVFPEVTV